jgi:hypothetical protein
MPAYSIEKLAHKLETPAIGHLPENKAHIQLNTAQGAIETFVGTDGINDIYLIDARSGLGPPDVLLNWDPGEDLIVFVNQQEMPLTVDLSDGVTTFAAAGTVVARIPEASVAEADSMVLGLSSSSLKFDFFDLDEGSTPVSLIRI